MVKQAQRVQLIDKSEEMCSHWRKHFMDCFYVSVKCGDVFSFPTACIVSPANSFGFMDGGLDKKITERLGQSIQEKLQEQIKEKYNGELLVGQAELVETGNAGMAYVMVAPTMRVPMVLKDTVNVYLAAKAIFNLLKNSPRIGVITISGLGTGVGQVPFNICARQMKQAYSDVFFEPYFPKDWTEAQERHQLLYSDSYRDLQIDV